MKKIACVLALLRRLLHLHRRKAAHLPKRHSQLPRILLRIYFADGVLLALLAIGTVGFYFAGEERAMEWFGVPAFLPTQWASPFLHFAISGVCWLLFGLTLLGQGRTAQATAASA